MNPLRALFESQWLVWIAALLAQHLWGPWGFVAGGAAGLIVSLAGADLLSGRRLGERFILRHRVTILAVGAGLMGVASIGPRAILILGTLLPPGVAAFIGAIGVYFAGMAAGNILAGFWGWTGPRVDNELSVRAGYLYVLAAAALADGPLTPAERAAIAAAAESALAAFGYGDQADLQRLVETCPQTVPTPAHAAQLAAALAPEYQQMLLLDLLRLLYAGGSLSPAARGWISGLRAAGGFRDWSLLSAFERQPALLPEERTAALAELGLSPDATSEQVREAYRRRAAEYHPDKMPDATPAVRSLLEAKFAAVGAAYQRLRVSLTTSPPVLQYRAASGVGSFSEMGPSGALCRCWLCHQLNRLAAGGDPAAARCGKCHALLGAAVDLEPQPAAS